MFSKGFKAIPLTVRRLLPTIVLLVLAVLAGATDTFSTTVHELFSKSLRERAAEFMPSVINILIVAILANIAWLLYHPLCNALARVLNDSGASDRGKQFALKVIKLAYWAVIGFVILSGFASELMGKFLLGFSVLGAALTLAMQGAANDFISGVQMQFTKRVRSGDNVQILGLDVAGKVVDVGYTSTLIEAADGIISVPNRLVWERAIKVKPPAPAKHLIIVPPGIELSDGSEKKGDK